MTRSGRNRSEISRPEFRVSVLLLLGALAWAAKGANSEWVYTGPDGKLVYKTTPAGDRIMDFSSAGYMGGGVALPSVPVRRTVEPSGGPDDTATIQAAIDAVSALSPEGGIDFKNRGSMGSGHGWGTGWSVAWNCVAKTYVVQQPPGVVNWMIGCIGPNVPTPRPFDSSPTLSLGTSDSPERPVVPQSLYLAQLAERLGPQAVKNMGY